MCEKCTEKNCATCERDADICDSCQNGFYSDIMRNRGGGVDCSSKCSENCDVCFSQDFCLTCSPSAKMTSDYRCVSNNSSTLAIIFGILGFIVYIGIFIGIICCCKKCAKNPVHHAQPARNGFQPSTNFNRQLNVTNSNNQTAGFIFG